MGNESDNVQSILSKTRGSDIEDHENCPALPPLCHPSLLLVLTTVVPIQATMLSKPLILLIFGGVINVGRPTSRDTNSHRSFEKCVFPVELILWPETTDLLTFMKMCGSFRDKLYLVHLVRES